MRSPWIQLSVLVGAMLVLGACSDDNKDNVARSTESISPPSSDLTASSSPATTKSAASVPPADGTGPQLFTLPSGNIGCALGGNSVRCEIRDKEWEAPPDTMNCPVDYGQSLTIENGAVAFGCHGDTVFGDITDTLGYGESARRDDIVCAADTAGITCTDISSSHGFFLSRESYRTF